MGEYLWSDLRRYAVTAEEIERDLPGTIDVMREYAMSHVALQTEMLRAKLAHAERAPDPVLHAAERFAVAEQAMHRFVVPVMMKQGAGVWTIYTNWQDEVMALDLLFDGRLLSVNCRLAVESGTPTFDLGRNQGPRQS
jgi:hypothetical protein